MILSYSYCFTNHFGVKINLGCRFFTAEKKPVKQAVGLVPVSEQHISLEEAYPIFSQQKETAPHQQEGELSYYSPPYAFPDYYPYFTMIPLTFAWFYMYDPYFTEE